MPRHTPILVGETFVSRPVSLDSLPRKRRRIHVFGWGSLAMLLGWFILLVG